MECNSTHTNNPMQTLASFNYFETLNALVSAIEQQTSLLPGSARDMAQQLLSNVEAAIQSVQANPAFQNLPVLSFDGGQLVAHAVDQAQFATEHLFRAHILGQLFAGVSPFTAILTNAMHQTGLWNQSWLDAYEAASGRSLSQPGQQIEPQALSHTESEGLDQGIDL